MTDNGDVVLKFPSPAAARPVVAPAALLAAILLLTAIAGPVRAQGERKQQRQLGAAVAPLRLIPNSDEPISIAGLHHYFGTIELGSASDGLVVVDRLPLERYLLGLNEVPVDWPVEALRAQAVAARTYALWTLREPPGGAAAVYGFDICASVQCQVFSGADVVATEDGERWAQAVEATAGEAILYGGAPILARYHSTSGGLTLANPQAFPGEPDYPYLRSVSSTTESASPLYRWVVQFRLADLRAILKRAGWWDQSFGRLRRVATIPSRSGLHYPDVVFEGARRVMIRTAEELRQVVRTVAPEMFPARYPSTASTTSGRLPETFPSNRLQIDTRGKTVTVLGRGWGHGVGMSQWGAHGLAMAGASYREVLAHFYSGVSMDEVADPGPIEVGVDWGRRSVRASGSFRIVDGRGRVLVRRALGTWRFNWAKTGAVRIDPPEGHGLPLRVGIVGAPREVEVAAGAFITIALSRPARVRTVTAAETGYDDPGAEIRAAGRRKLVWLAPLEPGRYEVKVIASTGAVTRSSEPIEITVTDAGDADAPARATLPTGHGGLPVVLGWVALGLLIAAAGLVFLVRLRGETGDDPRGSG